MAQNLEITTVAVSTTPVLLFSGTGQLTFSSSGNIRLGDSNTVTFAAGASPGPFLANNVREFKAPVELWGISDVTGTTLTVYRWV